MADNVEQAQTTEVAPEETAPEVTEQTATDANGDQQPPSLSQQPQETTEETGAKDVKEEEEEDDDDEDERKVFVGGLSWETQSNSLKDYMSKFGEVKECTIKIDNKTGKSRCFGFVVFKDEETLKKVMESKPHKVDGRDVDVKKAEPQRKEGKLFLGGLKPETDDEKIKEYFGKYGKIEKFERPFDKAMNQPKKYCFITFKKDGPIKKIIDESRYHEVDEKKVECKHAEPPSHGYGGGGRGGRGGGRGGMGGGWNQGGFGYGGGYNQGGYGGGPYGGNFGPGFGGGYGAPFAGANFNQGYGGGYGMGGPFGGGGGGGGYGYGQQTSGYGKSGRGRHMNNYKPY